MTQQVETAPSNLSVVSTEKADFKRGLGGLSRAEKEAWRRQLRENGRRPLAVNLAEGLALSEFIFSLPEDERPADHEALEVFRAAQRAAADEA
jgi:hypothetical protein